MPTPSACRPHAVKCLPTCDHKSLWASYDGAYLGQAAGQPRSVSLGPPLLQDAYILSRSRHPQSVPVSIYNYHAGGFGLVLRVSREEEGALSLWIRPTRYGDLHGCQPLPILRAGAHHLTNNISSCQFLGFLGSCARHKPLLRICIASALSEGQLLALAVCHPARTRPNQFPP